MDSKSKWDPNIRILAENLAGSWGSLFNSMLVHTSLLTLLLLATTTAAQAAVAAGDFKEEMQKFADDWREAFNTKDAGKLASTFIEDGELIVPRGNVLGTAAIRDEYRKEKSEEGDTLSALTVTRAVHSGNLAYITGT